MKRETCKKTKAAALVSIDGKPVIISDDPAVPACHSAAADQVRQKVSVGSGLPYSVRLSESLQDCYSIDTYCSDCDR